MKRIAATIIFFSLSSAALAQPSALSAQAESATAAQEKKAPPKVQPAPGNAYLYIGWPNNGEVIASGKPFRVWFGLRHMGVAPKDVKFPNTGHHHLLVDTELPPAGQVIPNDRNHLHFGAGETETMIELPPGKHTLQLLMGDENHVPHEPMIYSRKITITVK